MSSEEKPNLWNEFFNETLSVELEMGDSWQDYLKLFLQKVKEAEGYNDTGIQLLEDSINGAFEALSESEDYYEEIK